MDLAFYLTASLGIIIFGISKGGFAGPASILAVPIMSLSMNPVIAALSHRSHSKTSQLL